MKSLLLAFAFLLCLAPLAFAQAPAATPADKPLRAYHIGNSLTFHVVSDPRHRGFMSGHGVQYVAGYHVLWGQSLFTIWDKSDTPSAKTEKYGVFKNALANFDWDVLTLQPWGSQFDGEKGDLAMARKYIELATARNPDIQVYIYETWPFKDKEGKLDFAAKWSRPFPQPGNWDSLWNSTYCTRLVAQLNKDLPTLKKPVRLLPVGTVLAAIDQQIRSGSLPGVDKFEQLYKDDIHLTPFGYYIARCTFYAVLRRQSPQGLPASASVKEVSDEAGKIIQDTVWRIVTSTDATGVK